MILCPGSRPQKSGSSNAQGKRLRESEKKRSGGKVPKSVFVYSPNLPTLTSEWRRNVKLLSFGDDEGAAEEAEPVTFKKKGIVRPDCTCVFIIYTRQELIPALVQ